MIMLNNIYLVYMLIIDLSVECYTLDYTIIRNRLTDIGITDLTLDWLMSYIINNTIFVRRLLNQQC